MYTSKIFKFATEVEANHFVDQEKENTTPNEDKYIFGPHFMDESEIFKNMPWANNGNTWWQVTVRTYN